MTIGELIEDLSQYDPTKPVYLCNALGDITEVKETYEECVLWGGSLCLECVGGYYRDEDPEGKISCSHCGHRRDARELEGVTLF